MTETRKLRVFLCHSSQDKPIVRELYQRLLTEGWIDPWLDEEKLHPGYSWLEKIEEAVESADAVIVFLSNSSVTKEGVVQKEIRRALDKAEEKPEDVIFIIPLRLENCSVPRRLKNYQYQDYFDNVDIAYLRLSASLEERANTLEIDIRGIKENLQRQEEEKVRKEREARIRKEAEERIRREEEQSMRSQAEERARKALKIKIRKEIKERGQHEKEEQESKNYMPGGIRILYVEEDETWIEVTKTFLEHDGYKMDNAKNLEEMKACLKESRKQQKPYAMVLTEIRFDVDNNYNHDLSVPEFLSQNYPKLPCVVWTSWDDLNPTEIAELNHYNVSRIISKASKSIELRQEIKDVIAGNE